MGAPSLPAIEDMLMIEPLACFLISRHAIFEKRNVPVAFMPKMAFQPLRLTSSMGHKKLAPALLTSTPR